MDHDIRVDEIQTVKRCVFQIGVSVSKHGGFRFGLDIQTIAVAKRKSIENVNVVIMTTRVQRDGFALNATHFADRCEIGKGARLLNIHREPAHRSHTRH